MYKLAIAILKIVYRWFVDNGKIHLRIFGGLDYHLDCTTMRQEKIYSYKNIRKNGMKD